MSMNEETFLFVSLIKLGAIHLLECKQNCYNIVTLLEFIALIGQTNNHLSQQTYTRAIDYPDLLHKKKFQHN